MATTATIELSPEALALLKKIANERGLSVEELVRRGIGLVVAADAADKQGLKVGAAGSAAQLTEEWENIV